ncbi:MAG TPA: LysR family transcriptional regulator, partial [Smithellaceae bacterium]|nr:LysR family transcriptional regulator [Smithellaceae bacterium]
LQAGGVLPMEIKYKVWIEKNGKVVFGKGRDDILKAIDEQRSLNAAAKKLEMSYRAAWGRLKASEERMGMKLVEVGVHDKSMQLTGQARSIIDRFEKLEKDVERLLHTADQDFQKLLQVEEKIGKP